MPAYGVFSNAGGGHVVTSILIAMIAMVFTAMSYGRMARVYPSAGSAFTYVGSEIHPALGYVTGWGMAMDYVLNPIVCTILCSKFALNFFPEISYPVVVVLFIALFTGLNLFGIRTSARINDTLAAAMGIVIVIFLAAATRATWASADAGLRCGSRPLPEAVNRSAGTGPEKVGFPARNFFMSSVTRWASF